MLSSSQILTPNFQGNVIIQPDDKQKIARGMLSSSQMF
jgi:hypothetical protein